MSTRHPLSSPSICRWRKSTSGAPSWFTSTPPHFRRSGFWRSATTCERCPWRKSMASGRTNNTSNSGSTALKEKSTIRIIPISAVGIAAYFKLLLRGFLLSVLNSVCVCVFVCACVCVFVHVLGCVFLYVFMSAMKICSCKQGYIMQRYEYAHHYSIVRGQGPFDRLSVRTICEPLRLTAPTSRHSKHSIPAIIHISCIWNPLSPKPIMLADQKHM